MAGNTSFRDAIGSIVTKDQAYDLSKRVLYDKLIDKFKDPKYPEQWVEELFTNHHVDKAATKIKELNNAAAYAEKEMKQHMKDHYRQYIKVAEEMQAMTPALGNIRSRLQDLRATTFQMRDRAENESMMRSHYESCLPSPEQQMQVQLLKQLEKVNKEKVLEPLAWFDVLMSERSFEEAVNQLQALTRLVDGRGASFPSELWPEAKKQVEKRLSDITKTLCDELRNPALRPAEYKEYISQLTRLKQTERAKQVYLKNRTDWLQLKVRQRSVQREATDTVEALAHLYFGCINKTHDDFINYFSDPRLMSSFVVWAREQTGRLWQHCRKHVVTVRTASMMAECIERIRKKGSELLDHQRISLTFHLDRLIHPSLQSELTERLLSTAEEVKNKITDDSWDTALHPFNEYGGTTEQYTQQGEAAEMTESAAYMTQLIHEQVAALQPLTRFTQLYPSMLAGFDNVINSYVREIVKTFNKAFEDFGTDNEAQSKAHVISIMQNLFFITYQLMPRLAKHLQASFQGRPASQLLIRSATYEELLEVVVLPKFAMYRAAHFLEMGKLDEFFAVSAFRNISRRRQFGREHPKEDNPHLRGFGHAPEETVRVEDADGVREGDAEEPLGPRWPGQALDMANEHLGLETMEVSLGFSDLFKSLAEELQELNEVLADTDAKRVVTEMVLLLAEEMKHTITELKSDGNMDVGPGGLAQTIFDLNFFKESAPTDTPAEDQVKDEVQQAIEYLIHVIGADYLGDEVMAQDFGSSFDDWLVQSTEREMGSMGVGRLGAGMY